MFFQKDDYDDYDDDDDEDDDDNDGDADVLADVPALKVCKLSSQECTHVNSNKNSSAKLTKSMHN